MRHARSLLAWAEWLCGEPARRAVFEPLVADWHREWLEAASPAARAMIAARGTAAFMISLAWCMLNGGTT